MLKDKALYRFSDELLLSHLWLPAGFWGRLRGLIGRPALQLSQGMLLANCHAVHMFFMRYRIDVVFIDKDFVITSTVSELAPFSWCSDAGASHTLELAAGAIAYMSLTVGQQLVVRDK
ncbi:hypothetical protein SAMN05660691_01613 [Rheinheimera pacifica]|uniref:DUF192 domain-containing protein n=1 Tax=Rheinheimera pacifica TaxID=173990 RepID=A0A1H6L9K2_9GAMM|nr:DUF192 domain-containing protein [Rheinheimera pacifica]SEH81145.1 hypothetical protein SAMN05660691_01613 [Rheinheimera pacifica]